MDDHFFRDATKKKRIAEREEIKEMTQDQKDELKKLQKDSEMTSLYQREERKLFLGMDHWKMF